MSVSPRTAQEVLPHGENMILVDGTGNREDGWYQFPIRFEQGMSVVSSDGIAPPELGLEMMAQACGLLLSNQELSPHGAPRIGVVGAVRGYDYESRPFVLGDRITVRARPELIEEGLVVCEAEVHRNDSSEPSQRARITLIIRGEGAV